MEVFLNVVNYPFIVDWNYMHLLKNRKFRDTSDCNISFPNISTLSIYQREKHVSDNAKLICENMKKGFRIFYTCKRKHYFGKEWPMRLETFYIFYSNFNSNSFRAAFRNHHRSLINSLSPHLSEDIQKCGSMLV